MAKDPAFLFYPNDWIGGTMGMTFEEKGAYMELLMMQFNRGHMTEHMIGQIVGQLWVNIKDKFIIDSEGRFFNKRLEEEQEKRKSFTESRRNNIKGENQYSKNIGHKGGHMTGHMENENENEIVIKIESEKIPYREIADLFNSKCISLSKVTKLTDSRKDKIKARWSEMGNIETITALFEKMESTAFLKGENKENWKATFDWVFENDKNWVKIIEGNYDKNKTNGTNQQNSQKPKGSEQQSLLRV